MEREKGDSRVDLEGDGEGESEGEGEREFNRVEDGEGNGGGDVDVGGCMVGYVYMGMSQMIMKNREYG